MIKKIMFIAALAVASLYVVSCGKGSDAASTICTNTPVATDSMALVNFATANNITTTKDASGMYFQIVSSGTGATSPNGNSLVEVTYKGTLLNGTVFDSTAAGKTASFYLNQLIGGWQIGLPKIKAGGRIKMLIPSALAYGCQGAGTSIPSNAPIFFDVTLVSFQ
ncbi:FKBP-type peptidyl-prolyl cis-trans isomerase [Parasediminibacterium paludis]|uniref:Peptidyl-prolyl cis-trans isomerase n=1 Tax=Parasediminibacterium paludis TaxID=908966 RepID=A0ABV8Q2A7_9BACT